MKTFALILAAALVTVASPNPGHAHDHTHVSIGFGWWGGWPVYVAPPPVIYAPPPAVIYAVPPMPAPVNAYPASPVYHDYYGRLCREFQTTVVIGNVRRPAYGRACLQPDGSWQIVG